MANRRKLVSIRRTDGAYYALGQWTYPWALKDRFAGTMKYFPDRAAEIVCDLRGRGHDVEICPRTERQIPTLSERFRL
jgi:hypothetical protein